MPHDGVLIAVHGGARRRLAPQRGTLRLRVGAEHPDREAALRAALDAHRRVAGEAEAHVLSGAATRWTSGTVQAWPERREDGPGILRTVQVAHAEVEVRFRDLGALGAWIGTVGADPAVEILGLDWSVTRAQEQEVEREMRTEAVADAVRRAEDYAAALGGGSVRLARLWEPGLRPGGGEPGRGWTAQAMSRRMHAPEMRLQPEDIEVVAEVSADFELLPD